jgi:hypothetical protein
MDLLSKVQQLARATSDENVQLVQKVKELEVEVTVWKQALSSSRGAQDRENKPVVTFTNPQKNVALCVIDGTRSFFSAKYITLGEEGGRRAAQEVIRGITNHLADDRSLQSKVFIGIYVRRGQLRHDLVASGVCTPEQFDEFFTGLNETSYLNIVEVSNKRDADKKIEEYLQLFADLPQTVRVFFNGGNGPIIPTLDACTSTSKLVILRSQSYGPFSHIPSLILAGLFVPTNQLIPATPLPAVSPFPVAETDEADLRTPFSGSFYGQRRQSIVDPTLPLYKQNPPPCNEYYLMHACSKDGRCRYSHEYDLSDEQLATLAKSAKQSPCWFLNNDTECPHGTDCCWGHVCPHGIKCPYSFKDKCRFKGSGMHRPRGDLM